jgi:branched-chain amino acid transport system substrate-binding protein
MRTMLWLLTPALALLPTVPAIAQQGVTDTEIVMGCSNSFTGGPGALAFLSEQFTKLGIDLYFRVVNEAGGIHGRKVRTIYYDDGFKLQETVANTKKLVERDKVFAVLAPVGTASVAATLKYLEQNRVPLLFPYQGSTISRGLKYVVHGMLLSDRQARMMVDYLVTQRKFRTYGVIYQDDEYGKAFLIPFEKYLGRRGLKLAAAESVKRGATDVSAQIAKLRAAKPQVTFLVLTPVPGAEALKERQKIGWTDTVMVSSGPLTDERILALAGEAAEGTEGLLQWPDPIRSDLHSTMP